MSSVYYNPEDHDLEQIYEQSFNDEPYEFDFRVFWKHNKTGKIYTARDSGCSCPSPFEDHTGLKDLDEIGDSTVWLMDEVREVAKSDLRDIGPIDHYLGFLRDLENKRGW